MPTPKIRTQAFLANLPLFRELSAEEIDRIALGTTEHHVTRGSVVVNKGDPVEGFHLVVYGQIKLSLTTPQGDEKVVEIIGPGFSFGEALMFMGKGYIVTATALADSLLLHVRRKTVFEGLRTRTSTATSFADCSGEIRGSISFAFKTSGCLAPTIRQFSNGPPPRIAFLSRMTCRLSRLRVGPGDCGSTDAGSVRCSLACGSRPRHP